MRTSILLRDGWKFHAGADQSAVPRHKSAHYNGAKTMSRLYGFASLSYTDDSTHTPELWIPVSVPHDYVISQSPSAENPGALGSQSYGEAWYRRNFTFTDNDRGRRVLLCFEGAATRCQIFFNGVLLKEHHSAYAPFEVDISDVIRFDAQNLLAVRFEPMQHHEGWWYTGGGLVRDVYLLKTDPCAVDVRGVWVRPVKITDSLWRCEIETTLLCEKSGAETVSLTSRIGDLSVTSDVTLIPYGKTTVRQTLDVKSPRLWDTEDPYLYTCTSSVSRDGGEIDRVDTPFGFRTAEFKEDGFFLNGRRVQLNGVCCHEDYGITGRAVPPAIREYRVRIMREMGANAWRCAHYIQSEGTMNALDRAGMLVMAENRNFVPSDEAMEELETLVRRDRNRPGVILWSIGNEENFFAEERGVRVARRMIAAVKRLDPDRAVTAAIDKNVAENPLAAELDVIGVNYNYDHVDTLRARLPHKPMLMSECTAAGTTRGWYNESDDGAGMMSGYDRRNYSFGRSAAFTWKFIADRPWLAGGFHWSGLEYRGEAEWPRLCSQSGAVDLFLQKKDNFHNLRCMWTDEPAVHILPHWNWRGREGEIIPVRVYTNCAEVSLSLNGRDLGRVPAGRYKAAAFEVPYEPGTLCAVGYSASGEAAARCEVSTAGAPVGLKMVVDNADEVRRIGASAAAHITVYAVDERGNYVPDAADELIFGITGAAEIDYDKAGNRPKILGSGSSVCDPVPPADRRRKMVYGRAAVSVRRGEGKAIATVYGERLGHASVEL